MTRKWDILAHFAKKQNITLNYKRDVLGLL